MPKIRLVNLESQKARVRVKFLLPIIAIFSGLLWMNGGVNAKMTLIPKTSEAETSEGASVGEADGNKVAGEAEESYGSKVAGEAEESGGDKTASTGTASVGCPDVKFVFARGSGGERWKDQNYLEFKKTIEEKMPTAGLTYEFLDLDYPAVGVGIDNLWVTLGAFFGAGDAYEFGASVDAGVQALVKMINNDSCTDTKYVLGGYSQGAMVVSKALHSLKAEKIIYAATFGDPKLYLPEGAGLVPAACKGENLSDYRAYVPDCRAYEGLLGSYRPYEPANFEGKLGTWCNKFDIFCSSYFSVTDHVSYIADNLYEDAARMIAHKVTAEFELKNKYTSPHDTAILIDSTGSMAGMIDKFKAEATRLANETFESGGRVALYDYRDLDDPYEPVKRCDFETCKAENFAEFLGEIEVQGGGDDPESLLSASVKVMHELKWRLGATKSLVVLTDAPYLSPDRDATTVDDVVTLSKTIDPVNMYIITTGETDFEYPDVRKLAEATGGMVVTDMGELSLLTDYIMERYDSLPRVEEVLDDDSAVPALVVTNVVDNGETVTVNFDGSDLALVMLNDAILGVAEGGTVTVDDLDRGIANRLTLVPIGDGRRGNWETVELPAIEAENVVEETTAVELAEATGTAEQTSELENNIRPEKIVEISAESDLGSGASGVNKEILGKTDKEAGKDLIVPKAPDTGVVK